MWYITNEKLNSVTLPILIDYIWQDILFSAGNMLMHHEIRYFEYLHIFLSGLALPIVMPVAQWVAHFWLIWSFLWTVFLSKHIFKPGIILWTLHWIHNLFMLSVSCFSCQNVSCNIFNEFCHFTLWLFVKLKRK